MEKNDDPKARIADLQERRKLLVFLASEYKDRLRFDDPRGDDLDHSIDELRALRKQIHSIDTTLAEMEIKPDV